MFKNPFRGQQPSASPPNPEPLLQAMHTVALNDTPENRGKLYREFLNSWLWICVTELPKDLKSGITTLSTGMNIPVPTPNNAKGNRVLPAFTDPTALAKYDPNSPHLAFPALEVFKMALQLQVAEVVVNPFDPIREPIRPGGIVTRREFEAMAQGMIPERTSDGKGQVLRVQTPTKIQIGRCKTPVSSEMRAQLRIAAATFPELHKIFRYQMRFSVTGAQKEVFGLVCSAQASRFQEIVSSLMASVQPLLDPGRYVDFTALRADDIP
jgi:SseB protein N-terminal domain